MEDSKIFAINDNVLNHILLNGDRMYVFVNKEFIQYLNSQYGIDNSEELALRVIKEQLDDSIFTGNSELKKFIEVIKDCYPEYFNKSYRYTSIINYIEFINDEIIDDTHVYTSQEEELNILLKRKALYEDHIKIMNSSILGCEIENDESACRRETGKLAFIKKQLKEVNLKLNYIEMDGLRQ